MFWFQWMVMPLSLVPLANYIVLGSHLYLHNRFLSYQIVAEYKRLPSYSNNKDSSPDTVVNTACLILNKAKWLGSPYSKNGGGDKLVLINSFASFCAFLLKILSCVVFSRKRKFNLNRLIENLRISFVYRYLIWRPGRILQQSPDTHEIWCILSSYESHKLSPQTKFNIWCFQIIRKLQCHPNSTPRVDKSRNLNPSLTNFYDTIKC